MSAARTIETRLPEVLESISNPRTPAYYDDILGQVARTRQRPGWTFPERWLPMTTITGRIATMPRLPMRMVAVALLLLALAAGLALIAGSQRRVPPPFGPAANGTLVVGEGGDIVLIDPANGSRTLAIGGPAIDSEPVFSRDGTQFAFFREERGRRGLFVADAQGRGVRELPTFGLKNPSPPQWSPDGRSIIVNVEVDGHGGVAHVGLDGSAPRLMNLGVTAEDAVWMPPDGHEILFRTPGTIGFGLMIASADGSSVRTLIEPTGKNEWDALYFAPSPDGTQVAYQWRDSDGIQKIYLVSAAGGASRAVTSIESVLPKWSPDGTRIMFASDDGTYVVPADGSAPQGRLVRVNSAAGSLASLWTPDGARVLFIQEDGRPLLLDPSGGPAVEPPWSVDMTDAGSAGALPDWQRLAISGS